MPAARVPEKSVAPVAVLVASTQQAPDVVVKVTVKVLSATSYVADWAVAACGDETVGGGGVEWSSSPFSSGGVAAVELWCPLLLSRRMGAAGWDRVRTGQQEHDDEDENDRHGRGRTRPAGGDGG